MQDYKIITLPKIIDPRGNLTFLENNNQIPFEIRRVFWTYNVPGGETRGGHAYKVQQEIIIALSGSFDVVITNSDGKLLKISLNRSHFGLYLPPKTWRHIENFSTNSLGLHLSSMEYNSEDYIRDYNNLIND
ncbi:MAG: FdtA/QdtA family cupin domain-containing protein [Sediminibacterium sp.]|uniref:sugar 3,4-ketoisomerase n=1 Tax=Sediminibacterium sp. TaxID=1917865 RepID=UPI002AB9F110|nr:FdtA/QdtA family cupin domain-containing protein [Sediminibacterium sp.]MDZ4070743.1 FdtA/QdtA family cupin domain-containing protein [Sediminibacterium sp.]